jgi:hypothetical protein
LARRTIALAQQAKLRDPEGGYDQLLKARMRAVLAPCRARGIRMMTNMGEANPIDAAQKTRTFARNLGLAGLRIAAVRGDDLLDAVRAGDFTPEESGAPAASLGNPIVSALADGADVIITGRDGDPALFLVLLVHEFGWAMDDWKRLGRGTLVGHLLECAGQIAGGYFADPGCKDVSGLARLGFPSGIGAEDGTVEITKVDGSGGRISLATSKGQMPDDVHDPARYLQPDVVGDFSEVEMEQIGPDRVRATGAPGSPAMGLLKVSVGYIDSCIGEGQISYAGPNALARGRLGLDVVREALRPDRHRCVARGGAVRRAGALRGSAPCRRSHRDLRRGRADRQRGRDALHQRTGRAAISC